MLFRSAIGIIIGMAPMYTDGLVADGIVAVDGLTGSSGAGKKPAPTQHFSHLNDNVIPYRVLNHQHVVEAEMTLGRMGPGTGATVDFIPHLLGTTRGILNTMHVTLARPTAREALLARTWKENTFVTTRSVDTLVKRLRRRIEADPATPAFIHTVWGVGYKFADA